MDRRRDAAAVSKLPLGSSALLSSDYSWDWGAGGLHPRTGSCGEGQSSLTLLQQGEKGAKSRGRRDGHLCGHLLSSWDARPREPGVMQGDSGSHGPVCQLLPMARGEGMHSRTAPAASPFSPCCLLYAVHSLYIKPHLDLTEAGWVFSPSDTVFNFCLPSHRRGES